MRVNVNCALCAELVSFEVEGFSPLESVSISEVVERECGHVDAKEIEAAIRLVLAGRSYKRIRLFKNCPKCGAEVVFVSYVLVS
jgi:endogenous inhibitor of DNA gyrase (YacG/DUF329 family)